MWSGLAPDHGSSGRPVAVCPLHSERDVVLDGDDLKTFEVDAGAIVEAIKSASPFRDPLREILPGVWRLGEIGERHAVFITFLASAVSDPKLPHILHESARGAGVTLAGPPTTDENCNRIADTLIHFVSLDEAIPDKEFKLEIERLLPSPAEPILILERASRRVTLRRRSVVLTPRAFDMLGLLVEAVLDGSGTVLTCENRARSSSAGKAAL